MAYTYGRTVTHCPYCGAGYAAVEGWPRDCPRCGETLWANPLPVAVALLPVVAADGGRGLVVVRRDIEPCRGELALPGGYMEIGEDWRQAAARELWEETGLTVSTEGVTLYDVHSTERNLNVFALFPPVDAAGLPPSRPTSEATEWLVLTRPATLAFPTHTDMAASYLAGAGAGAG
ncbi:NUDIX domain-containing protein [Streptomyces triticirhizae]|uniref:NUDIX domain-containing protein n=1 Tax=Streptomyces triticirhizae TaxID=2483353 RepID=A0A3M2LR75_9ACTN|nr:NUDIX domain-containing protein [Streptomyces triticirhizae]RMI39596.1 NUDIX domain-containing protein [Streptomyces triticirhizae]